jgi:hypothetical protein
MRKPIRKTLREYLVRLREQEPEWLSQLDQLDTATIANRFLSSRLVYYPGSRWDGGPIACFNSSHAAHCFVYVDYGIQSSTLKQVIANPGFTGYRSLPRIELKEEDLTPGGWVSHAPADARPWIRTAAPYGFIEVLERIDGYGESHGAKRFAVLFLGADGFATFDALFCQPTSLPGPWCVVLQDHGFGGNYDRFGAGGILEELARSSRRYPDYLLVGGSTEVWQGYTRIPDVAPETMGDRSLRRLWKRWDVGL